MCATLRVQNQTFFKTVYSESRARAPVQRAADGRSTIKVYRGDTLYSLARRYRTSVGELASANGLFAPYALTAGQTLGIARNSNSTRASAQRAESGAEASAAGACACGAPQRDALPYFRKQ